MQFQQYRQQLTEGALSVFNLPQEIFLLCGWRNCEKSVFPDANVMNGLIGREENGLGLFTC